jgi:adenosylcobyric acid synthase
MAAKALMIQGTGSHVGKSLVTAALCRIFTQEGFRVRPFKAQNMSNNAYVTSEGGEMGRAQAEQAMACGVEPSILMNPILLKPTTDLGAQVIVMGHVRGTLEARAYEALKPTLQATVLRALGQLRAQADLLIIEGAGSPAEINLRDGDLVNMWIAKQTQAHVVLVGNIDWGGVFAQCVGTMELLEPEERRLVRGFFINKFRGDKALLDPGVRWLERRYGLPVLGVIPYFHDVELLEEDTVSSRTQRDGLSQDQLRIEILHLPRISNATDFAPLEREPDVQVRYIDRPSSDGPWPDCLILPGSKSTMADLAFVRERGLETYLRRGLQAGTEVVGICGGFQMLSREIRDPHHVEASVEAAPGLGLLPVVTVFEREKITTQVRGTHLDSGLPVAGYEIHMGRMREGRDARPVVKVSDGRPAGIERDDGAQSSDGRVWGTHMHGLFDTVAFRRWWLDRLRRRRGLPAMGTASKPPSEGVYDRLADAVRPHVNLKALADILGI